MSAGLFRQAVSAHLWPASAWGRPFSHGKGGDQGKFEGTRRKCELITRQLARCIPPAPVLNQRRRGESTSTYAARISSPEARRARAAHRRLVSALGNIRRSSQLELAYERAFGAIVDYALTLQPVVRRGIIPPEDAREAASGWGKIAAFCHEEDDDAAVICARLAASYALMRREWIEEPGS